MVAPVPVMDHVKLEALFPVVEYVKILGPHVTADPTIIVGRDGYVVMTGTFLQLADPIPQALTADTQIKPPT